TLASMVFVNKGGRFEAVDLPRDAQLAPAFAVNVADFDGDGQEDIFLGQNFFATRPAMPRLDAGRGLWLQGNGRGSFRAVPGAESGILLYGEQRGAAAGDFDEDGRLDLAVSQNGAATALFQNVAAKPGLRIRLLGPPGNPAAVGAVMRLLAANGPGPAREIHVGSGYWSQDSSVQILGSPVPPEKLWIRWPGGRETTTPIPSGSRKLVIDSDGQSR
ncbi:MAG TPA: VCBS repeat-containing protein, partial [Verrucomicrobiae bacterium]|nr:VCBS repeat-containing protein [Verrucomicrobiae bacterium]